MAQKDRRVDVLFQKRTTWVAETAYLRELLLTFPLVETFKWKAACYTYAGSNVAMIFRLKDSCGVSFFRGALFDDPDERLEKPGPNSQSARYFKVHSLKEAQAGAPHLETFIKEAIRRHADGDTVDFKAKQALIYPDALTEAFQTDAELKEAFKALTPGRQRSWVMHIVAAKQEATRVNRIAKGRGKILAGKGQSEY